MKMLIFIFAFIIPTICNGQNTDIAKLITLKNIYKEKRNYDSLIIVCSQIKSISSKISKEERVDYYIADSYFEIKQYSSAIKYSKKYLRKPAFRQLTRKGFMKRIYKRILCYNLYEIYKERGDYKRALKYLQKIDKKYDNMTCGTGKRWWLINLYTKMIECYSTLNDQRHIDIYKRKIKELQPDW